MKLLVDTNILIDYLRQREPFYAVARKLMIVGYVKEAELWISSSQATDLIYILSDGGQKSKAKQAKRDLKTLRRFINIGSIGEKHFDSAIDSSWSDLEDALIYQAALGIKVDAIITRNKRDFDKSSLRILDCNELFEYLKDEKGLVYEEVKV